MRKIFPSSKPQKKPDEKIYVLLLHEGHNTWVMCASANGRAILREAKRMACDDYIAKIPGRLEIEVHYNGNNGARLIKDFDCLIVNANTKPSSRCKFGSRLID